MIIGTHFILYAHAPEKTRAFFKDVLGLRSVDAGRGWLIFALPPSEIAAHPIENDDGASDSGRGDEGSKLAAPGQPTCEVYLMCDDVRRTVDELKRMGVEFGDDIFQQPWGLLTSLRIPGAGQIGLYEPRHPTAIDLKKKEG